MWHKPCRTFHPWCPCIKTRSLLSLLVNVVVQNHRLIDVLCIHYKFQWVFLLKFLCVNSHYIFYVKQLLLFRGRFPFSPLDGIIHILSQWTRNSFVERGPEAILHKTSVTGSQSFYIYLDYTNVLNTLRPRQNGWHFTGDIFKQHFLEWKLLYFDLKCH